MKKSNPLFFFYFFFEKNLFIKIFLVYFAPIFHICVKNQIVITHGSKNKSINLY